jgi:hypothetical protein
VGSSSGSARRTEDSYQVGAGLDQGHRCGKVARIDANWQPVSAPTTTSCEVGSTARARISLPVNPSSAPGTGSLGGWPPTATTMASPVNVRSCRMLTAWSQLGQKAPRQDGPRPCRRRLDPLAQREKQEAKAALATALAALRSSRLRRSGGNPEGSERFARVA